MKISRLTSPKEESTVIRRNLKSKKSIVKLTKMGNAAFILLIGIKFVESC